MEGCAPFISWTAGANAGPLAAWGDVDAVAQRLRVVLEEGPVPEEVRRRSRKSHSSEESMARLSRVYERAVGLP
jgi:hypothetical protein